MGLSFPRVASSEQGVNWVDYLTGYVAGVITTAAIVWGLLA